MNPFDLLTTFLGETWQWIKGCFNYVRGAWNAWVAAGGVTATLALMDWPFEVIADGVEGLSEAAALLASHTYTMPGAGPILGQVNRVFPLNEILVMEAALLGLYISCILLRWAKGWIPGL